MKKFLIFCFEKPTITEVEVEKETKKCIWISGKQMRKRSDTKIYFNTYDEAHKYIVNDLSKHLEWHKECIKNDQEIIDDFIYRFPYAVKTSNK